MPKLRLKYGHLIGSQAFLCLLALVVALFIAAGAFELYDEVVDYPFQFDDISYVQNNRNIHDLKNITKFFYDIEGPIAIRPMMLTTFAVNYFYGHNTPHGYHLMNNALHSMNGILLFFLVMLTLKRLGMDKGKALLAGMFTAMQFVFHPVQTESVTYVVGRSELLSAMMYLSGLLVFLRASRFERPRIRHIFLLLLISLMGMASKEHFVTFPAMLLLYDFVFIASFSPADMKKRAALHAVAWLSILYLVYLVSHFDYGNTAGTGMASTVTPLQYLMTQFEVHFKYLRLLVFPFDQNLDYDIPVVKSFADLKEILSLLGYLSLWGAGIMLIARKHIAGFAILWFMVTLSPTSSIVPLADMAFEHRLYLPSIGLFVLASSGVIFMVRHEMVQRALVVGLCILIPVYASASHKRNAVWKSPITLWEDVTMKSPMKARGHINLGLSYADAGYDDKALMHYLRALDINPFHAKAHYNLAHIYHKRGEFMKAIEQYEESLREDPTFDDAWADLGEAQRLLGYPKQAIVNFKRAIEMDPLDPLTLNNLGFAYMETGETVQAERAFKSAISIYPQYARAHYNLGLLYTNTGRDALAREEFSKASANGQFGVFGSRPQEENR